MTLRFPRYEIVEHHPKNINGKMGLAEILAAAAVVGYDGSCRKHGESEIANLKERFAQHDARAGDWKRVQKPNI